MKIQELFEAVEPKPKHPFVEGLKGKKLSYVEMIKLLDGSDIFEKSGRLYKLKKDAGVNIGPVMTALRKACGENVTVMNFKNSVHPDWNWDVPLNGTVVLDQVIWNRKSGDESNRKEVDQYEKDAYAYGMKNAKGTAGGKGWFVSHNESGSYSVIGRFDEGPLKGDLFRVTAWPGDKYSKGDKVKVKVTSVTYGRVKLV
jgi:hypothetical protein